MARRLLVNPETAKSKTEVPVTTPNIQKRLMELETEIAEEKIQTIAERYELIRSHFETASPEKKEKILEALNEAREILAQALEKIKV